MQPQDNDKSWQLIEKLLLEANREQQRRRRWSIFFRLLLVLYLGALLVLYWRPAPLGQDFGKPVTAEVSINGEIAASKPANAHTIIQGLDAAFADKDARAVMLKINSPGGSPVQAREVYEEIMRLRKVHPDKKIYAVITDLGASGAYYIASAANEIYADPASIVGSIGVIMSGFGFNGTLKKLGVDRRVLTAGSNKDMLDPFAPANKKQNQYVQGMLNEVHQQFIQAVKQGRGSRLKVKGHPELFSGLFWIGADALKLGLIDGLGSPDSVARNVIGAPHIQDFTRHPDQLDRFLHAFGASVGQSIAHALGMRASIPTLH